MSDTTKSFARPIGSESIVNKIVTEITDLILDGTFKPGDKLPTETDLCTAFQVGRNSVREAVKILEAYGIVHIKRADGTFINDSYTQKMLNPMLYGILLEKNFGADIIELRKILDMGILYSVIDHITEDQLLHLKEILARIHTLTRAEQMDLNALFEADVDFHMALSDTAGNHLLNSMYGYVDKITAPSRIKAMELLVTQNHMEDFYQLHLNIVDLIEQKKLTAIESTLNEHYQFWNQIIDQKEL